MREPSTEQVERAAAKFKAIYITALDPFVRATVDQALNDISFHHADDSGKEWGTAKAILDELADYVIEQRISYSTIHWFFQQGHYLCDIDSLMSRVLNKLYERLPT